MKDLGVEWGHDQKRDPSGGEAHPQDDSVAVRASPKGRDLGLALACHPERTRGISVLSLPVIPCEREGSRGWMGP